MSIISASELFTPWTDPQSGVVSYILSERVAPYQMGFYFTNPAMALDSRYLWFYAAWPPSFGRCLAAADLEADTVTAFPETRFSDASPMIDPETGLAYWGTNHQHMAHIWRRGPGADDKPEHIWELPEDWSNKRMVFRLSTHLTFSADRKELNLDMMLGNEWVLASVPVDGSHKGTIWQTFDRMMNHAQFSPTDPDLMLIAQDWVIDPYSGEQHDLERRLWLIRRGEKAEAIFPDLQGKDDHTHEYWDRDGRHVWYVSYGTGTHKVNIETREDELVFPEGNCHSHTSPDGKYIAADCDAYAGQRKATGRPCRVAFYNIETGKSVYIMSDCPIAPDRSLYHIDPHPQFSPCGTYVFYTTYINGQPDVAAVEVEQLAALT